MRVKFVLNYVLFLYSNIIFKSICGPPFDIKYLAYKEKYF